MRPAAPEGAPFAVRPAPAPPRIAQARPPLPVQRPASAPPRITQARPPIAARPGGQAPPTFSPFVRPGMRPALPTTPLRPVEPRQPSGEVPPMKKPRST